MQISRQFCDIIVHFFIKIARFGVSCLPLTATNGCLFAFLPFCQLLCQFRFEHPFGTNFDGRIVVFVRYYTTIRTNPLKADNFNNEILCQRFNP